MANEVTKKTAAHKNPYPVVGEDCIHCGLCAKNCPVNAITVDKAYGTWEINTSACILCGTCEVKCLKKTISIDKEAKRPASASSKKSFALPIKVPRTKGVLLLNEKMCAGCSSCAFACSLTHEGFAAPHLSRIKVDNIRYAEWDNLAKPCLQCEDPLCMRYCPCNAIYVDKKTGARVIDEKLCIGCQECMHHCPFDPPRIVYNKEKMKAYKCDLCGGDPECVKSCPFGALTYFTDPEGVVTGYIEGVE